MRQGSRPSIRFARLTLEWMTNSSHRRAHRHEVDYLIPPALGRRTHNFRPQSYAARVWNARVKAALEDRLRDMICDGKLDLATAQREIATNWLEAYKKHFIRIGR